jgi:hypothetical protein
MKLRLAEAQQMAKSSTNRDAWTGGWTFVTMLFIVKQIV